MPLYRSVRCELFVQGLIDEGEIEDIKCEIALKAAFEEENEFAEVLQALIEYNLHHEEKVHILGMDTLLIKLSLDIRNSARDLIAAFINSGNKEKMLPILEFMDIERWPHKLLEKNMETESFLRSEIGDFYFGLVKLIINQYDILGSGYYEGRSALSLYDYKDFRRDYHMWLAKSNDYILFLDKISPSREKRKKYTKEEIEEKRILYYMICGKNGTVSSSKK